VCFSVWTRKKKERDDDNLVLLGHFKSSSFLFFFILFYPLSSTPLPNILSLPFLLLHNTLLVVIFFNFSDCIKKLDEKRHSHSKSEGMPQTTIKSFFLFYSWNLLTSTKPNRKNKLFGDIFNLISYTECLVKKQMALFFILIIRNVNQLWDYINCLFICISLAYCEIYQWNVHSLVCKWMHLCNNKI